MTFRVPQPTGAAAQTPAAGWNSTRGWETDMIVWPVWPCFTAHAHRCDWMEELHACFCLQGHSAHPQLLLTVQRVRRQDILVRIVFGEFSEDHQHEWRSGSAYWEPNRQQEEESRHKKMDWTKDKRWKNQSPSGESAWTLLDWGRTEDETESGGMKGTNPPAAG